MLNRFLLSVFIMNIFLGSYSMGFANESNVALDKEVVDIPDSTNYYCSCSDNYGDTLFKKQILFFKNQDDLYYLDFVLPNSIADTIRLNDSVYVFEGQRHKKSSKILFDLKRKELFTDRFIDSPSGIGVFISLTEINADIFTYTFRGILPHSNYISRIKISLSKGIIEFHWYDGTRVYKCKRE